MFDQSFNPSTLAAQLQKSDFRGVAKYRQKAFREAAIKAACRSARTGFQGSNPLSRAHAKKTAIYRIDKLPDDLVVRKLTANLNRAYPTTPPNRTRIIKNLCHFFREGVPYRLYKFDVRNFYESFDTEEVKRALNRNPSLSNESKTLVSLVLDHFLHLGGTGLPRGMAISATISEILMTRFDSLVISHPEVFFFARYVDDIVLISTTSPEDVEIIDLVKTSLPAGLNLNTDKCTTCSLSEPVPPKSKLRPGDSKRSLEFSLDYLGYRLSVFEPLKTDCFGSICHRHIRIDIAPKKLKRIKTRIARSFLDFSKTKDESLLIDRIRFLSSNFSIVDRKTGKRKIAGIFHSYPLLTEDSDSLQALDSFLRDILLSKSGRRFAQLNMPIRKSIKRLLLSRVFETGHSTRRFLYFPAQRIATIQSCWKDV